MGWSSQAARNEYQKRWYAGNRKWMCAYQKEYRTANAEKLKGQRHARYLLNKEAFQKRAQRQYSKSADEGKRYGRGYPRATRPMPVRCECCKRRPSRRLALDHCHRNKRFRGWLCQQCNLGIGMLGDSLKGVQRAVRYLRRNAR